MLAVGSVFAVSLASMRGVIGLGDMADKGMTMLEIACHDCPKMQKPSSDIYDRCGVYFPELPRWF